MIGLSTVVLRESNVKGTVPYEPKEKLKSKTRHHKRPSTVRPQQYSKTGEEGYILIPKKKKSQTKRPIDKKGVRSRALFSKRV